MNEWFIEKFVYTTQDYKQRIQTLYCFRFNGKKVSKSQRENKDLIGWHIHFVFILPAEVSDSFFFHFLIFILLMQGNEQWNLKWIKQRILSRRFNNNRKTVYLCVLLLKKQFQLSSFKHIMPWKKKFSIFPSYKVPPKISKSNVSNWCIHERITDKVVFVVKSYWGS